MEEKGVTREARERRIWLEINWCERHGAEISPGFKFPMGRKETEDQTYPGACVRDVEVVTTTKEIKNDSRLLSNGESVSQLFLFLNDYDNVFRHVSQKNMA